jgi:hypothetical protein
MLVPSVMQRSFVQIWGLRGSTSHRPLPLIEAASWRLPAVIFPTPALMSISQETGTLVVDPDHETMDQVARRIIDYMAGNPIYRMQGAFNLYC